MITEKEKRKWNKKVNDGITNKKRRRGTYLSYLSEPLDKQNIPLVSLFSRANSNIKAASARESLMLPKCCHKEDFITESKFHSAMFTEK